MHLSSVLLQRGHLSLKPLGCERQNPIHAIQGLKPNTHCDGQGWGPQEGNGSRGRALMSGIGAIVKQTPQSPLSLSPSEDATEKYILL